jgi:hypothetical protein
LSIRRFGRHPLPLFIGRLAPVAARFEELAGIDEQIRQVDEGEEPGLGAQQAGQGEEGQDGPAGAGAFGLYEEGAEDEGDVGEVYVGAQAVGQVGRAGDYEEGGEGADRAVEPEGPQAVDEIGDEAEGEVGDDHRHVDRAAAQRRRHQA